MKTLLAALLLLMVGVGVAGCGRPSGSPPVPDQRFGAPVVLSPRDVRDFAADPCSIPVTASQWRALGFSEVGVGDVLEVTGERTCTWQALDESQDVTIIVTPSRDVLVDTYRARQFDLFRPAVIQELPATVEQSSAESIGCTVTVGTAEGQGFVADYYEGNLGADGRANDPCGSGQRVADQVAAALPLLAAGK